jgi:ADP-heptose:LPS heptosyltransferase
MRILATNPDTIGDVILRQPMYRALMEAGHELMLLVRPLLTPVVGSVVPGARVATVQANIYDPRMRPSDPALEGVVEEARDFNPDAILVAPYQWTVMSERLSREFPEAKVFAFSGKPFSDPNHGPARTSELRITNRVEVAEESPEVRKNELMAAAVLGRSESLPDPTLEAAPEHITAADAILARLGYEPGKYWVACVGDTKWTKVRNWQPERWAEVLREWSVRYGRHFLLIGQENEAETARQVRSLMGDRSGAAAEWFGRGDGDLDVLLGLVARSAGYIGRDTGPMHISAAMRKPVLAVFGGGTWPRFVPQVDPSITVTLGVPCAGCNWVCHLPESYCIKDVPVASVLEAVDDLESGRVTQRTVRVLKPDGVLLTRIGREGAVWGRAHLTQLSLTRRESMEQTQTLADTLDRTARQAGRAEALAEQLDTLKTEMARRESLLKQRIAATEAMLRAREEEWTGGKARAKLEAEIRARFTIEEAARAQREADLRTRLSKAQAELTQAQAENADLKIRLERVTSEHSALANWSRQLEDELQVVRPRLHELMSSRWRRYGQRLHLCMTLPWEKAATNGHLNGKH